MSISFLLWRAVFSSLCEWGAQVYVRSLVTLWFYGCVFQEGLFSVHLDLMSCWRFGLVWFYLAFFALFACLSIWHFRTNGE